MDVAQLNQRLKQLGYGSLNEFVGGITADIVSNKQVVEELADVLAGKIVNNLLTTNPSPESIRTNPERGQARWAGNSAAACLPRTHQSKLTLRTGDKSAQVSDYFRFSD
jgi:hypothetical protein